MMGSSSKSDARKAELAKAAHKAALRRGAQSRADKDAWNRTYGWRGTLRPVRRGG
jgi:hypothetical protein